MAKFKEGDRVWITRYRDEGSEQPTGTVLTPGRWTIVKMDLEFCVVSAEIQEFKEDQLERIHADVHND
jgi:hypothetical protein